MKHRAVNDKKKLFSFFAAKKTSDSSRFSRRQRWGMPMIGIFLTMSGCETNYFVVNGDTCPEGTNLATYLDATMNNDKICEILGDWEIARLREGGSIDGPGYGCTARESDNRQLGTAVCRRTVVIEITSPPEFEEDEEDVTDDS